MKNLNLEKLEPGTELRIITQKEIIEGILLPKSTKEFLLIKLKSGYNIGIDKKEIKKIEIIGKTKLEEFPKATIKQNSYLPLVTLVIAGGTIASRVDYTTGGVSSLMDPENLLSLVPEISQIAQIKVDWAFNILSENINKTYWFKLTEKISKWLNKKNTKGIVVTHGTDTLHYTTAALSFMLRNLNKPVMFTYAQRSSDRPSTDAILNLKAAFQAALTNIAEVCIVGHGSINDDYCLVLRGTKVRKMHSTRRDTFRPINDLPLAKIWKNGKIEFLNKFNKRDEEKKVKVEAYFNDKIALLKFYPNADPSILEFLREKGYRGVIIEASGMGHVNVEGKKNWLKVIKEIVGEMFIGFAPQTLYGNLDAWVYATGRKLQEAGVIYLKDILPETAYVKLGWVLGKTRNLEKAKKLMLTNLANEFSEKEILESFLY